MKSSTIDQGLPKPTGIRGYSKHKTAVLTIIITSLLLTMTATSRAQAPGDLSVNIRPIEDFLKAQGSEAGVMPAPYNECLSYDPESGLFMGVDYAGLINQWLEEQSGGAISLGTTIEGRVIERPLKDGRAEVTVLCHAKNAFMTVMVPTDGWFTVLFGCDPYEALLAGGQPALGESFLRVVFINDAPGAPLPDLAVEGETFPLNPHPYIRWSQEVTATGPLREAYGVPDGTPGRAQMTQVGLWQTADIGVTSGNWPAEHINLQVVGH